MHQFLKASSALALAISSIAAVAQTTSPDATRSAPVLEEVIVTAQRRAESLQDAAIPIAVATGEALNRLGIDSVSSLNTISPSLSVVTSGGSNANFFVRGVGNFTNNAYSDPAIAFSVDGVYLGRPTSTTGAFLDVERVEVLKGPQGTLYGRNATGGAVNVIPVKPELGELSGKFSVGAGNYESREVMGAINVPIGDNYAARLAGTWLENDGYNDDGTDQTDETAWRAQIYGEPSESLNVRLSVDYANSKGAGPGQSFDGHYQFAPGTPAGGNNVPNYVYIAAPASVSEPYTGMHTQAAQDYFSGLVAAPAFVNPEPLYFPSRDNVFWGVTAEINAVTPLGDLTVIPAYRVADLDNLFNASAFRAAVIDEKAEQASLEVRLSNSFDGGKWIVGGYWFDETVDGRAGYGQVALSSLQKFESITESYAAFGQLTIDVTDAARLVGGLRYTEDDKSMDGVANTLITACTNPPPPMGSGCFGGPSQPAAISLADMATAIPASDLPAGFPTLPGVPVPYGDSGNILFYSPTVVDEDIPNNELTWRVAVEYDVTPDSLLYASYETGYRSGGFALAAGRETFDAEYIDAFTLGSKNRFFDNRLELNIELFHWEYDDQQVSHFGLDVMGRTSFFTENIGRSTVQGADVDFQFAATASTTLHGSVQYLSNEYDEFEYTAPRGGTSLPPVVGCPYSPGTENIQGTDFDAYVIDCSGNDAYNAPEMSVNLGVEQRFQVGGFDLTANLDGHYRGNRKIGFEYLPEGDSGSDLTVNAALSMARTDANWSLSFYVRNLTDEEVPTVHQLMPVVSNVTSKSYMPPRTYGVQFSMGF